MQLRPLGSSGLLVSPICLGTMTFGTPVGEADAIRLTHAAIDLGIKPDWVWKQDDALFDRLEVIALLAAEAGVQMAQYSLAWTLTQPATSSLIVGVKSLEQIPDASAATDIAIPPEHLPKLDAICPPPWRQPDPIRG